MRFIEKTSLLYEISEALKELMDIKKSLYKVLGILADCLDLIKGTITLFDPDTKEIRTEVATVSRKRQKKVVYKLGEVITGRVIQTTICLPVSRPAKPLHRRGKAQP